MIPPHRRDLARHPVFDRVVVDGRVGLVYCAGERCRSLVAMLRHTPPQEGETPRVHVSSYTATEARHTVEAATMDAALARLALDGLFCDECGWPVPLTTIVTEED